MRLTMKRFFVLSLIASFLIGSSGCATYRMHPEFKERHKNIKSASIMPPQVDAYLLTFKGDQKRLHDLIPIMEKTTIEQIEKVFSKKGYVLEKLDLSEPALAAKAELRTALFNVNQVFEKSLKDIERGKKRTFTYSLGSEVNVFADISHSDVLIFIKEEGIKKSAGEIAKDIIKSSVISAAALLVGGGYVPTPKFAATIMHVAVVDANDGAILWYNNNIHRPDCNPEDQNQVAYLVKSLINPFPNSAFKTKGK